MKKKNPKAKAFRLDPEEEETQRDLEHGVSTTLAPGEAERYQAWAQAQLKRKPISLRVNEGDLNAIKALARSRGVRYQTLLGDLIHQVAVGQVTWPRAS